jgi:hypothetical protein
MADLYMECPETVMVPVGTFENRWSRFADQVELSANFERHEELTADRFDEPIVAEDATLLRATVRSRIFKEDQELQVFTSGLSQVGRENHRGCSLPWRTANLLLVFLGVITKYAR